MRALLRTVGALALALLLALARPARATCFGYTDPFACSARATAEGCTWCVGGAFGGFCAPRARVDDFRALGACARTLDEQYRSRATALFSPGGMVTRP